MLLGLVYPALWVNTPARAPFLREPELDLAKERLQPVEEATAMAKKMRTSRAALNRLLDENDTSLTLTTLAGAAAALGRRIKLELAPV